MMKKMTFKEFSMRAHDAALYREDTNDLQKLYDEIYADTDEPPKTETRMRQEAFKDRVIEIVDSQDIPPTMQRNIDVLYKDFCRGEPAKDEPAVEEETTEFTKDQLETVIDATREGALERERANMSRALKAFPSNENEMSWRQIGHALAVMARPDFHTLSPYDVIEGIFRGEK